MDGWDRKGCLFLIHLHLQFDFSFLFLPLPKMHKADSSQTPYRPCREISTHRPLSHETGNYKQMIDKNTPFYHSINVTAVIDCRSTHL